MRVCFVTSQAVSRAGWGRYTVEVIKGVQKYGIEPVLVMSPGEVDPDLQALECHPILPPILTGRLSTPRSLIAAPALRRILQSCDAVHCIVELYAPLVALALPSNTAYILSVFGTWAIRPLESRFQHTFFAPAFQKADRILSISSFTRDWLAKLIDLPQIEVLAGGVHPSLFQQKIDATLPEWVGREPTVLSVGAVKPRKGQDVAVEAIALARERFPTIHYAMAGNENERPEFTAKLKARISELGLQDNVHFLGQLPPYSTLVAWYQRSDVFLLPSVNDGSSFEGLGLVFLEAAAAGTPSIGTFNCGATEAIQDGETGLLVPQNDPGATATALTRLLEDDNLRGRLSAAAPGFVEQLSWDNLAARVVEVYRETKSIR